jgi:dipeptidyl aminopeptidase/acylaminoacyl peptidase
VFGGSDDGRIGPDEVARDTWTGLGVPVETLYFPSEGHGFYTDEHRREYYTRLLAFLSKHLGGAKAK